MATPNFTDVDTSLLWTLFVWPSSVNITEVLLDMCIPSPPTSNKCQVLYLVSNTSNYTQFHLFAHYYSIGQVSKGQIIFSLLKPSCLQTVTSDRNSGVSLESFLTFIHCAYKIGFVCKQPLLRYFVSWDDTAFDLVLQTSKMTDIEPIPWMKYFPNLTAGPSQATLQIRLHPVLVIK